MDLNTYSNVPPSHVPMMEGRITVGPFKKQKGRDILMHMMSCDVQVAREEGALYYARNTRDGFLIQAEGPGVFGYLVDEEKLEADESALVEFAKPFVKECGPITIEGSHMIDNDMRMVCRTVLEDDPLLGVKITCWRKRVGSGVDAKSQS
ncbi:hypothetical protein KUV57_12060 [Epibacterium sp. DP7N7-1]|nr:hypothetical protein [Epibacterium sp. DP7N7-1]